MNDSTLDLFCQQEDDRDADQFAMEIESLASKYKVTVEYYMAEFM